MPRKLERIIDEINSPADLRRLSTAELTELAAELREEILNDVCKNGGHLSSNLGVIELTLALCRVLDLPKDKLIWDVGHQSYAYKILTGRREALKNVRKLGGACGFCLPSESEYDFSVSGHSSASLSTALGAAAANELNADGAKICAVIGDGALTGGLAYEALDNIGHLRKPMLIVLNDNEMSITKNVGSISKALSRARSTQSYRSAKLHVENVLNSIPVCGKQLSSGVKFIKEHIKYALTAGTFFETLGITYLGPVNGHSVADMEELFRRALRMDEPVLVHVITQKGRGYAPAEAAPQKYHGVYPFEKSKGLVEKCGKTYSSVFGSTLCSLAEKNSSFAAITPSMTLGSGLTEFSKRFRKRFFDVGIAEGHAVTFGAGLAGGGVCPVICVYSSFLQRAYDNVIHDLAIGGLHAVLAVDRCGLVPGDGATHQGVFDVAFLSAIPNVCVLSPSSFSELEKMLDYCINEHKGVIAVRYPRGSQKCEIDNGDFILGKAKILRKGSDVTLAAYGSMVGRALRCADELEKRGMSAEVIDLRTIKPIDTDTIIKSGMKTERLVFMEEVVRCGGIGEQLITNMNLRGVNLPVKLISLPDGFVPHATMDELEEYYGFTTEKLVEKVTNRWFNEKTT